MKGENTTRELEFKLGHNNLVPPDLSDVVGIEVETYQLCIVVR